MNLIAALNELNEDDDLSSILRSPKRAIRRLETRLARIEALTPESTDAQASKAGIGEWLGVESLEDPEERDDWLESNRQEVIAAKAMVRRRLAMVRAIAGMALDLGAV